MKVATPAVDVETFDVERFAVEDPLGEDPAEALIKEAKQRARRRRLIYGIAAVLVAIAAVAVFSIGSSSDSPPPAAVPAVSASRPSPLGEPLVVGADAASTLLTSWGEIHIGYVFVYADGRVVWYPDGGVVVDGDTRVTGIRASPAQGSRGTGAWMTSAGVGPDAPAGEFGYAVVERRLSPHGVELVLAGQLTPRQFLGPGAVQVTARVPASRSTRISWQEVPPAYPRSELWAEPAARLYDPSRYAICHFTPPAFPPTHAVSVDGLPPAVQPLLDGKLRTYDPSIAFTNPGMDVLARSPEGAPLPPMECFELTAAETAGLYQVLDANDWIPHPPDQPAATLALDWYGWAGGPIHVIPIYPHGQPVLFDG
jgi:hypothetical protein